jgi:hypothetical protein
VFTNAFLSSARITAIPYCRKTPLGRGYKDGTPQGAWNVEVFALDRFDKWNGLLATTDFREYNRRTEGGQAWAFILQLEDPTPVCAAGSSLLAKQVHRIN